MWHWRTYISIFPNSLTHGSNDTILNTFIVQLYTAGKWMDMVSGDLKYVYVHTRILNLMFGKSYCGAISVTYNIRYCDALWVFMHKYPQCACVIRYRLSEKFWWTMSKMLVQYYPGINSTFPTCIRPSQNVSFTFPKCIRYGVTSILATDLINFRSIREVPCSRTRL